MGASICFRKFRLKITKIDYYYSQTKNIRWKLKSKDEQQQKRSNLTNRKWIKLFSKNDHIQNLISEDHNEKIKKYEQIFHVDSFSWFVMEHIRGLAATNKQWIR